jgi:hypothetical protein
MTEGKSAIKLWSPSNTKRWETGFAALLKFRRREGHCCPSRYHIEGKFNLGQWVSVQRYRKHLLPVERKRHLDGIGFIWDTRDQLWEQNLAALLKFKRRKGHCCVPTFHRRRHTACRASFRGAGPRHGAARSAGVSVFCESLSASARSAGSAIRHGRGPSAGSRLRRPHGRCPERQPRKPRAPYQWQAHAWSVTKIEWIARRQLRRITSDGLR